jgi:hypothetical protein
MSDDDKNLALKEKAPLGVKAGAPRSNMTGIRSGSVLNGNGGTPFQLERRYFFANFNFPIWRNRGQTFSLSLQQRYPRVRFLP